jgi:hypothetical protein
LEFKLALPERSPGVFEGELSATVNGVWRARVRAEGKTFGGSPFTREQLVSGAVLTGGDRPPDRPEAGRDRLKCFLECLSKEPGIQKWFKIYGVDSDRLWACLLRCSKESGATGELLG